jgi:hypothetical protein
MYRPEMRRDKTYQWTQQIGRPVRCSWTVTMYFLKKSNVSADLTHRQTKISACSTKDTNYVQAEKIMYMPYKALNILKYINGSRKLLRYALNFEKSAT